MEFPTAATGTPAGGARSPSASAAGDRHRTAAAWLIVLVVTAVALTAGIAGARSSQPAARSRQPMHHDGLSSLPMAAQGVVSATLGADLRAYAIERSAGGLYARNASQGLRLRFDAGGVKIRAGATWLGMSLRAVGYGRALRALAHVRPSASSDRVSYARAALSEWYANGPLGLEQGFTIARALPGDTRAPLTLSIALSGDAQASLMSNGRALAVGHAGAASLRYAGLFAADARGRTLHAWLELRGGRLLVRVDARGARYPVRVDPLIQQGQKLTAGGEAGQGLFGSSVALSGDGNTALIGAPFDDDDVGAAWVFTRSGSTWTQQGEKLTPDGESGEGAFGSSVALAQDGDTAVIGGSFDHLGVGAAWVFTRAGSTWTQQGEKLTAGGESGGGAFGSSVALSDGGNTALIGAPFDAGDAGAAWLFTRSGSTWIQQEKLTGSGEIGAGGFGFSVALSADDSTALIGGEADAGRDGAAWVFTRSGSSWTQQGEKLTGAGEIGAGAFGYAVALSCDGSTALIGGEADGGAIGAAWVFTRSGSSWTQQGEKLIGATGTDKSFFGDSVALSCDGNTALVGGHDYQDVGAVWEFTRSGSSWTRRGGELAGGEEIERSSFGSSIALSSDGETALIGGPGDDNFRGAAWVLVNVPTPSVTRVGPRTGPSAGGVAVTITGANLLGATAVDFGSSSASFTVDSASSITAISPTAPAGRVEVTVTTPYGTSAVSARDRYRVRPSVTSVNPSTASGAGGTSVIVTGAGFLTGKAATSFRLGSTHAKSVSCASSTTCIVLAPAHQTGTVEVKATVSKVSSSANPPADQLTYSSG